MQSSVQYFSFTYKRVEELSDRLARVLGIVGHDSMEISLFMHYFL